ncbi:MAG: hypothetical protein ACRD0J_08715 [Acidimicrobiales bacterium]
MPMREECKHFQSRTYASGEVARFCILDLAPEAPWRCPAGCRAYERRLADVSWSHGNLVEPALEEEPSAPTGDVGQLLDAAEEIVNSIGPSAVAEAERERAARAREQARVASLPWWRRLAPNRLRPRRH